MKIVSEFKSKLDCLIKRRPFTEHDVKGNVEHSVLTRCGSIVCFKVVADEVETIIDKGIFFKCHKFGSSL